MNINAFALRHIGPREEDQNLMLKTIGVDSLDQLIYESILIKKHVVDIDPFEQNLRKTLNYGHTLGHAIESYFLTNTKRTTATFRRY